MNKKQAVKYLSDFVEARERIFEQEDRQVADELGQAIKVLLKEVRVK